MRGGYYYSLGRYTCCCEDGVWVAWLPSLLLLVLLLLSGGDTHTMIRTVDAAFLEQPSNASSIRKSSTKGSGSFFCWLWHSRRRSIH